MRSSLFPENCQDDPLEVLTCSGTGRHASFVAITSYSGTLALVALEITGRVPALGVPMARRPQVMNRLDILRRGVQALPLTVRRLALAVALAGVVTCVLASLRVVAIDAAMETIETSGDNGAAADDGQPG